MMMMCARAINVRLLSGLMRCVRNLEAARYDAHHGECICVPFLFEAF